MSIKPILVHSMSEAVRVATALEENAHITVLHDDSCTPSNCSCQPDYLIEPLTVESYRRGAEAQARWLKETCS